MSDLVWEEPPPMRQPQRRWDLIAAALRERPGQWARIAEYASRSSAAMVATRINRSHYKPLKPAGAFEGAARQYGDGWGVYARYVGEQDGQGGKAPTAGEAVPNRPGRVVGDCGHPVWRTVWDSGERTCQPCQDAFAAEMSGGRSDG